MSHCVTATINMDEIIGIAILTRTNETEPMAVWEEAKTANRDIHFTHGL